MTATQIAVLLESDRDLLTSLLSNSNNDTLGKVYHVAREHLSAGHVAISGRYRDFYYFAEHDAYLAIETTQDRSGELSYGFAGWRLQRGLIG